MENEFIKFCRSDAGQAESEYAGETAVCVPRALAHVVKLPFEEVYEQLFLEGWKSPYFELKSWLARTTINGMRFHRLNLLNSSNWIESPRIEHFCRKFRTGSYLVESLSGPSSKHLFAVEDDVVYDTHLCSGLIVTCWRVVEEQNQ